MAEFYIRYEYWLAFSQLVLAMFGMGATLRPADFVAVVKTPKALSVGLLLQMVCVPLFAFAFMQLFSLPAGVAIGFAIVAAIPGGATSNVFTYFARGHVALSIAITAITTVACLLTVPVVLQLLIGEYVPTDFEMPASRIALEILTSLLIPLAAGMLLLHLAPSIAERVSKWAVRLSLLLIITIIVTALGAGRLDAEAMGTHNMMLVFGFMLLLMLAGVLIPKLWGLALRDITAIDMEITIRNINLGILIKALLFPATGVADPLGDLALFVILLYGGVQNGLVVPMILLSRKLIPAASRE